MMNNTKYFEELNIGDQWRTPRRTITESDMVTFNNSMWILLPSFVDEEHIKANTQMERRFATGVMTIPLTAGLFCQLHILDDSLIAMLGMEVKDMTRPLYVGDTIYAEVKVVDKKETSKSERGIVYFQYTTKNQRDEALAQITEIIMVKKKTRIGC